MADILEFAILRASETVACSFATHRSVGAGSSILKHFLSTTESKSTATGKDVIVI